MPKTSVLFATRNPFKGQLFAPAFHAHGFGCITLAQAGIKGISPLEDGNTTRENAVAKARAYVDLRWPIVLGDDAGLEIDALNGEPGVKARRWGGLFPDNVDDETWLNYLLSRLQGVPLEQRTARFVASWAIATYSGETYVRDIVSEFVITERPIRPISPGSPITAVRLGNGDDLGDRQREIAAEWRRWGILDHLQKGLDPFLVAQPLT